MPILTRTVPSQVVQLIERAFTDSNPPGNQPMLVTAHNHAHVVLLLQLLDALPQHLWPENQLAFLENVYSVRVACDNIGNASLSAIKPPRGQEQLYPIAELHTLLSECPDERPIPSTHDLAFVADTAFREGLRSDISTVGQALSNSEWKAATVLAGSVVEALLLTALERQSSLVLQNTLDALRGSGTFQPGRPKDADPKHKSWSLYHYVEACNHIGLIREKAYLQSKLIVDFRDLIHAAKEKRGEGKCSRGTAHSAFAAIEHVVEDLCQTLSTT